MKILTSEQLYGSFILGAKNVIENQGMLNMINVFPIKDGDTGTNLSSMMKSLIRESYRKDSIKETMESIANAALKGARGNSGLIFAQYLNGLSIEISDEAEISLEGYINANKKAFKYAYEAIDSPIEGTIITVMREWGNALKNYYVSNIDGVEIIKNAVVSVEEALENTKNQIEILKKENVVDSGAKGFTLFIQGILNYFTSEDLRKVIYEKFTQKTSLEIDKHSEESNYRFCTECILESENIDEKVLKSDLRNYGDSLIVVKSKNMCKIHIHTDRPDEVFTKVLECGSISYQKVDDMVKQKDIVENRKHDIAVVTDSIADIPEDILNNNQIHRINLNLLSGDSIFLDRIGISNKKIFELINKDGANLSSSQPNRFNLENFMDYLANYYNKIIILTVSGKLSGTYGAISKLIENEKYRDKDIRIINTKLNSGAQGLIVEKCARLVSKGLTMDLIVENINKSIPKAKILVKIPDIENMVRSGRLNKGIGKFGSLIGMKPVVTLDEKGRGKLHSVSLIPGGDTRKIIKHIKKVLREAKIASYCISYVDNPEKGISFGKKMTDIIGFSPEYITETSTIVAMSAGKGSVAISYILEEEE